VKVTSGTFSAKRIATVLFNFPLMLNIRVLNRFITQFVPVVLERVLFAHMPHVDSLIDLK